MSILLLRSSERYLRSCEVSTMEYYVTKVYWLKAVNYFRRKFHHRCLNKPLDLVIQTLNISLVNAFWNTKEFSFLFQVVFCYVVSIRDMCCYFFHCVCICFRLHGKIWKKSCIWFGELCCLLKGKQSCHLGQIWENEHIEEVFHDLSCVLVCQVVYWK